MASIKLKDIKNMQPSQLEDKLSDLKKELIKLNAQVATGTNPQNPGQIRQIRKTIARIKTVINQSEKIKGDKFENNHLLLAFCAHALGGTNIWMAYHSHFNVYKISIPIIWFSADLLCNRRGTNVQSMASI